MRNKVFPLLLLLLFSLSSSHLFSEFSYELSDEFRLRLGGDIRARYEGFNRDVIGVDGELPAGPAIKYARVRTRIGASLDMPEGLSLNVRFVNRFQHFTSHMGSPNNKDSSTWQFPDEVILDLLNLKWDDTEGSGLSITLGRQEIGFGNGMLISEGSPYDQGRSVYHDGIVLRYQDEEDTITVFSFYNEWKDRYVFINDRNRRLRSGDIFTLGTYWTHKFDQQLNVDLYYMYNDVDDKQQHTRDASERNHPVNGNLSLHTFGGRVFGTINDNFDYSVEIARQGGRNNAGARNQGMMFDARVRYHLPEETLFQPSVGFEILALTGDKSDTRKSEGWNSLMMECPLWREELMTIMNNGVWTNLNMYRGDVVLKLTDKITFTGVLSALTADETGFSSGGGHYLGTLFSAFLDYKMYENLTLSAEMAHFKAGDYYANGQDSCWARIQAMITF